MPKIDGNQTRQIHGSYVDSEESEAVKIKGKAIINPFASPYYNDSMSSSHEAALSTSALAPLNSTKTKSGVGWNHQDTMTKASPSDGISTIAKAAAPILTAQTALENLTHTNEKVSSKEAERLLEGAYKQVSPKLRAEVDAIVAAPGQGSEILIRHMEALSRKIDEALKAENRDFDKIHALVLRFCMIHMRNVSKEDQEYIAKIGDQIKVQAGKIRDTYNTWPVLTVTLVSSAVSIGGGAAGFSSFMMPSSEIAKVFASNSQQISTASTGISGISSLLNSRNEGDRQILQLTMKRDQDREEEKKSAKHGNKESQKGFRSAAEELFRNIAETIRSILRG